MGETCDEVSPVGNMDVRYMTGTAVTGPVPSPLTLTSQGGLHLCAWDFSRRALLCYAKTHKRNWTMFSLSQKLDPPGWSLPLWVGLTSDEESAVGKPATRMSDMTGTAKADSVVTVPPPTLRVDCLLFMRVHPCQKPYEMLFLPPPPGSPPCEQFLRVFPAQVCDGEMNACDALAFLLLNVSGELFALSTVHGYAGVCVQKQYLQHLSFDIGAHTNRSFLEQQTKFTLDLWKVS